MNRSLAISTLSLMVLLGTGMQAQASGDVVYTCQWGMDDCRLAGTPWLDVNNDTRDNLLRLVSAKRGFALPLYPLPADDRVSRDAWFGFHMLNGGAPVPEAEAPTNRNAGLAAAMARVDIKGQPPVVDADDSDGRFISNNADSAAQFINALADDPTLHPTRRHSLAAARLALLGKGSHMPKGESVLKAGVTLPGSAGEFRAYLGAAEAFYQGDYPRAITGFSALQKARQQWVAETASYMLMRVYLNQSTAEASDEYGLFEVQRVQRDAAAQALQSAQSYLKAYPHGRYAAAASGMMRRIYWYLQRPQEQAPLYQQALEKAPNADALQAIVIETDNKLQSPNTAGGVIFTSAPGAPLLNFTQSLRWMRPGEQHDDASTEITPEVLKRLEPQIEAAEWPGLKDYLDNAWRFWQANDYEAVLADIKPDYKVAANDVIGFSRQVLYGNSLMKLKRWPEAESHWRKLLAAVGNDERGQLMQMKLAALFVFSHQLPKLLDADSPVTNLRLRSLALKTLATPERLRQQVENGRNPEERTIALHTLLMRDLQSSRYGAWLKDSALRQKTGSLTQAQDFSDVSLSVFDWTGKDVEPGYTCQGLRETVETLSRQPHAPQALNCLGEFSRLTNARIDLTPESGGNDALDEAIPTNQQEFPLNRQAAYRQVISDPKASASDKSFALYRAVRCYAPSGYNDCGGEDVSKATRRQWFNQLKKQYPDSQWAAQLKYYW
ncbi:hypothetical protein TUM12370_33000 [Salmonella enterica subsp. enterica serovar Choleraesuis]|nr:hypothetical protein TUM12370_33000 [Salmonella enterica subsp. enterica serovar Choleraesuis]